jgi:hypothetical protein
MTWRHFFVLGPVRIRRPGFADTVDLVLAEKRIWPMNWLQAAA